MITRTLRRTSNSSTDNSLEISKVLRPAVRKGLLLHMHSTKDSFKEKANRGRFLYITVVAISLFELPALLSWQHYGRGKVFHK